MIFTALLGNPVEHSVAPYLYAELAKFARLEFVHLKLNSLLNRGKKINNTVKVAVLG